MKRNLSEWASIAEIIGAVAIVISLLFVGFQVRESAKSTQSATQQMGLGYELQILFAQGEMSREGAILLGQMTQGLDFSEVTEAQLEAENLYIATMRLFEDQFLQHEAGALAEAAWQARLPVMSGYANGPSMSQHLEQGYLQPDFIDFMRNLQENPIR